MKSKTKIGKQIHRKNSSELVETLVAAKKHKPWLKVAGILSGPRRKFLNLNLGDIDKKVKEGETILVPGKVLSQGEITKKIKIVAFSFSGTAMEKLLKSKTHTETILNEIKKNPEAKGLRILVEKANENN